MSEHITVLEVFLATWPHEIKSIIHHFFFSCYLGRFYCIAGSTTPRPTDGISGAPCPVGHYCPSGSEIPTPCLPGTYMAETHGKERCPSCPEGMYCVPGHLPQLCPKGEFSHGQSCFIYQCSAVQRFLQPHSHHCGSFWKSVGFCSPSGVSAFLEI